MSKFVKFFFTISSINLILFSSTFAESSDNCKKNIETSWHMRLEKYLFCHYKSRYLTSHDGREHTSVNVELTPLIANFNEENGNLELSSRLYLQWNDVNFEWETSSFDDIAMLELPRYKIWAPEITVLSGGNEKYEHYGIPWRTICAVWFDGLVTCSPRVSQTIRCQTDFTQWPYDRQNCTLVLTTWAVSNEKISLQTENGQTLDMDSFKPNGEWTLTPSRVVYHQRKSRFSLNQEGTSSSVSIDFILDRVHNQLSGRYITPAIIMMVMTLTTVWLDPRSIERLTVACVNPIVHLYCMQELHMVLPHNGSTVPNILIFYAYSLVLAAIALFLTFILGYLQEIKIECPQRITSSIAAIVRSKVGRILLFSMLDPKLTAEVEADADDSNDLLGSNSRTTAWVHVTIVCGWISFITFLFTYIIMYAVLVPNSSMRPPTVGLDYDSFE